MRKAAFLAATLLATGAASAANAQQPASEPASSAANAEQDASKSESEADGEVIVVGTRFIGQAGQASLKLDVPLRDIPLSVTSYSDTFLKALNTTRVDDVYSYIPGVGRTGSTGLSLSLRGFNTGNEDRGTVLVDGLPGLTSSFASPTTISVASVEFVKGANSVLYGKAQPGGFLNIISKKPQAKPYTLIRVQGQGYTGNHTDFGDSFSYTLSFDNTGPLADGVNYRIIAERNDGDGWRDFSRSRNIFIAPSIQFALSPRVSVLLQYEYRHDNSHKDEFLVVPNNDITKIADFHTSYQDPDALKTETGHAVTAHLDVDLGGGFKWRTAFRGVSVRNRSTGFEQNTISAVPVSVRYPSGFRVNRLDRDFVNKREYYFGDTNLSVKFDGLGINHYVLVGASLGRERFDSDRRSNISNSALFGVDLYQPAYNIAHLPAVGDRHRLSILNNLSVYAQDLMTFSEHFKGVVAIRYDREKQKVTELRLAPLTLSSNIDAVVPLAGLIFQPSKQVSFYGSFSKSFNPPSPSNVDALGKPLTAPEKGRQVEAGVKLNLMQNKLNGTLAFYDIKQTNTVINLGGGVSAQIGGVKSRGVEVEVNAAPIDGLELKAGYAFNDSEVSEDVNPFTVGQALLNAPRNGASFFASYSVPEGSLKGLGANLGVAAVSERFSTFAANAADRRVRLPGYTRVDLGLVYAFDSWELALRARNVFDKKYINGATGFTRIVPGDPRNFTLTLQKTF